MKLSNNTLILGDSLSFPRPAHDIHIALTWPFLLSNELQHYVVYRANGGATAHEMLKEVRSISGYYKGFKSHRAFNYAIVEVGIVDCCPRPLPKKLYFMISRMRGGSRLLSYLHRSGFVSAYGWPWVSLKAFKESIKKLFNEVSELSDQVIFIEIAHPAHFLIENCGDFSSVVDIYNSALYDIAPFVVTPFIESESLPELLLPDGHHLSIKGHRAVADSLKQYISTIEQSKLAVL